MRSAVAAVYDRRSQCPSAKHSRSGTSSASTVIDRSYKHLSPVPPEKISRIRISLIRLTKKFRIYWLADDKPHQSTTTPNKL